MFVSASLVYILHFVQWRMKILSVKAISGRAAFPPSHFERFGSSSSRPVQKTVLAAVCMSFSFSFYALAILVFHSFKSLGHCMTFLKYFILFSFLALRVEQLRKCIGRHCIIFSSCPKNFTIIDLQLALPCPCPPFPCFLSHFLLFLFSACWVVCLTFGDDTIQILEESN